MFFFSIVQFDLLMANFVRRQLVRSIYLTMANQFDRQELSSIFILFYGLEEKKTHQKKNLPLRYNITDNQVLFGNES